MEKMIMPEYGRNVQGMIAHALTLKDRAARNLCAKRIIRTMANLHPELNSDDKQRTYYDHLALMSGFQLDIDYPYGVPQPETLRLQPAPLHYSKQTLQHRHYGRVIQLMIEQAMREEDIDKRHKLTNLLANRMKYTYLVWNKNSVEEQQITDDITRLSKGLLTCDFEGFELHHAWQLIPKEAPTRKKKKK